MSQEFVGSLDCGTTSTRFIVFDRHANIVAQHQIEFPQYYPEPGWHEHDPEEIIQACQDCIGEVVRTIEAAGHPKSSIKVVGITNQRETAVVWSRRTGRSLAKAIVWADSRTKHTVAHLAGVLDKSGLELGPDSIVTGEAAVYQLQTLTGLKLSTYFSAVKLRWLIDHHAAVRKAHEEDDLLFGTVESWIVYHLTDRKLHVTEVSNASRTLLMNIKTLQWEPVLLKFFRIKPSVLPKIVSSSQVYGEVEHGPLKGVKIGGLIGDQQGALVGNKCFSQGEAKCTFGTGAFLLFNTGNDVVKSDSGLLATVGYQAGPDSNPVYALEGSIAVAGSAIKWLRDSMYMIKSSADIDTLADTVETTGGVYFVTAFSGLLAPYWDPTAAAMLVGLTESTTPAHIARATLEATAFQAYGILECMQSDAGADMKQLKVDGGMTNGDVAMQILADLGGFTVVRPEMRELTALGSALLAGSAIRLFGWDVNKPETLAEVNTRGHTDFVPELDTGEREQRWARWQRAVEKSRGWDSWDGKDESRRSRHATRPDREVSAKSCQGTSTMPRRVPLSSRPLDFLYFTFVLIHIPCTVLFDTQAITPQYLVPKALRDASEWYIALSGDPLIRGAFYGGPEFNWFRSFLYLETFFQLPIFFFAARALYAGPPKSQTHYPIMLAYSASSCTTTFGCLAILWTSAGLTQFQMLLLMGSYVPFFLVPFGMAIDMTLRLTKAQGTKALKTE